METYPVSSEQVKYFLYECFGPAVKKLRDQAQALGRVEEHVVEKFDQGAFPAWTFLNSSIVQEFYQAEGATNALRMAWNCITRTDIDETAFMAVMQDSTAMYRLTVDA